jgi:hypothetical protein
LCCNFLCRQGFELPATNAITAAPAAIASDKPDDEEKDYRSERGANDLRDHADPEMEAKAREQPVTDESADDTDDQVAYEAEAAAAHDLTREPAGHDADDDDRDQTVICKELRERNGSAQVPRINSFVGNQHRGGHTPTTLRNVRPFILARLRPLLSRSGPFIANGTYA